VAPKVDEVTRVNLVGAPGAGKTALADALFPYLIKKGRNPLRIIDHVHVDVERRYDLAVGMAGGYIADISVALERIGQERLAFSEGIRNFIVCGSLVECAIHTAINAEISGDQFAYHVAQTVTPLYPLIRMSMGIHPTYLVPYLDDEVQFHRAVASQMVLGLEALDMTYQELPVGIDNQVEFILNDLFPNQDTQAPN
jgi:hypothetical protein